MAFPDRPRSRMVDAQGTITREWILWFQLLADYLTGLVTGVSSWNTRTGAVTPAASDYDDTQIDNTSHVAGATVKAALENLLTAVVANQGRLTSIETWIEKTAAYTADANDRILCKTDGGAFTVKCPASPTKGDAFYLHDPTGNWNTANLTVDGNGKNIMGAATLVLNTNNDTLGAVYNGTEWRRLF